MKKITAIFIALIIFIISIFSVNAFASETDVENSFDISQTHLAKWNEKANADKEYEIKLNKVNEDGSITEGRILIKDDSLAFESSFNGHNIRIIENSRGQFMYFTKFPIIYFNTKNIFNESFAVTFGIDENMTYIKAYEESGYYVEEFYDSEAEKTIQFYFQNDELIMEKSDNSFTEYNSREIDDKEVNLPSFCINATPLIYIIVLFIA